MGNSEVGHKYWCRIVYQSLTRIDKAIEDGEFAENEALNGAYTHVTDNHSALHIFDYYLMVGYTATYVISKH